MANITFDSRQSAFFDAVRVKVDEYFLTAGFKRSGNLKLYTKSAIQVCITIAAYGTLVFFNPASWLAVLLCILLGLCLAVLGFNIMHEGGHSAYSSRSWVNNLAAYSLNVLGGNTYFWKIKHNVNHHTYTNIQGVDSDIDVGPFMRLHKEQPLYKLHRFQHLYFVVLYGISYAAWVFYEDFLKYFRGKVAAHMPTKGLATKEHVIFWLTKVGYVFFYLVLPMIICGWQQALIGFAIVSFTTGFAISIVFQLAHVVEGTTFPTPDPEKNKIQNEWAVHQVNTTSNFATRSRLLFWLLGGLNFQIEHHLFPRISHIHYPAISKIVRQVCSEYKIVYNEHVTFFGAIRSHLIHLRSLGISA
jgi:linoleoyl-CoA desaturase